MRVSGVGSLNSPRPQRATTFTPARLRMRLSASVCPSRVVAAAGTSAIRSAPKRPITLGSRLVPSTRRAIALPRTLWNWKTWVLPASCRMSRESSWSALATVTTCSHRSRMV